MPSCGRQGAQSSGRASCLLETQLYFQRLRVRAVAPGLWCFFSFLFCFLSDKSPFWGLSCLPWCGEALPGQGNSECVGPPSRRGSPQAHWVHQGHSVNSRPRLPGHEAWALVGTVPIEPCPVPWARPGSDLVGELPGPFGLGSRPSSSLPFILGPSTGHLLSLILELTSACQGLGLTGKGSRPWERTVSEWFRASSPDA